MPIQHDNMAKATPDSTPTGEVPLDYSKGNDSINDTPHFPLQPEAEANDENDYPTSLKLISVVIALVLAVFLASLDMNMIATAIPRITDEFHSLDQVNLISERTPIITLTSCRLAGTARPCSWQSAPHKPCGANHTNTLTSSSSF